MQLINKIKYSDWERWAILEHHWYRLCSIEEKRWGYDEENHSTQIDVIVHRWSTIQGEVVTIIVDKEGYIRDGYNSTEIFK